MTRTARHPRFLLLAAVSAFACLALALLLAGCCDEGPPAVQTARAGEPVMPSAPDLSKPEAAVRSYLDWVSFSYRMANSEIPSMTMTPYEGVHVDSYIEWNRQQGRGIEQHLEDLRVRGSSKEGTRTLVTTKESWRYRYFSLADLSYLGPENAVSYDATYTVVREADGRWLVDKVEATPLGEVE